MIPPERSFYRALAPIWILLLIVGSLMPFEAKLAIGTRPGRPVHPKDRVVSLTHRAYHWASFGSAAIILLMLSRNRYQDLAVASSVAALGVALEFAQHVMYRNVIEWWDMRDDAYGAIAALLLLQLPGIRNALVRDRSCRPATCPLQPGTKSRQS